MKTNLTTLVKLVMGAAAVALLSAIQPAEAASCKMEVKVPGSIAGANWVLVQQGAWPRYGGRVVWDPSLRCYVTDDVTRGETMRITITPNSNEDTRNPYSTYGIWCVSKSSWLVPKLYPPSLPYVSTFVVPTDPSKDDVHVKVQSQPWCCYTWTSFDWRIPIGPRVR